MGGLQVLPSIYLLEIRKQHVAQQWAAFRLPSAGGETVSVLALQLKFVFFLSGRMGARQLKICKRT